LEKLSFGKPLKTESQPIKNNLTKFFMFAIVKREVKMYRGTIIERLEILENTVEELKREVKNLKKRIESEKEERIENIKELEEKIKEKNQEEKGEITTRVLLEVLKKLEWESGIDFREEKKDLGWRPND